MISDMQQVQTTYVECGRLVPTEKPHVGKTQAALLSD